MSSGRLVLRKQKQKELHDRTIRLLAKFADAWEGTMYGGQMTEVTVLDSDLGEASDLLKELRDLEVE